VNVFPVKGVLKELYDVLSYRVLCSETFSPGKENAGIKGCLLDREGEGHRQGKIWSVHLAGRHIRVAAIEG
jgi:hypothetical protein